MAEWVGRTPDETVALIEEFNASKYFGELIPHPFAVAAMTDLYARGWNIEVVTSCGCDPASVVRRTRNLTLIFKHLISDIHCVPLGTSKIATLSKFDQAHWIEDNYENALAGHMVGHKSFVIRQRHNAALEHTSHAGITWVDNLMQIAKQIPHARYKD